MAINLVHRNYEPPELIPSEMIVPLARRFMRLTLWLCFIFVFYIILMSTVIVNEMQRPFVADIYDNVVTFTRKNISPPEPVLEPALNGEKALVTQVDYELAAKLSGYILLQIEEHGEAWYVNPTDLKKYYLGQGDEALAVFRRLGLGTTHAFLNKSKTFPASVAGKILLDIEKEGEAYYIYPKDKKAYFLGQPADAERIIHQFGVGISNLDIRRIEVGELE